MDEEKRTPKFAWGGKVSDHPLWSYQGLLGILLAFVTFAGAYFAARSRGEDEPGKIDWRPIAGSPAVPPISVTVLWDSDEN